jgi:hypothetical protein
MEKIIRLQDAKFKTTTNNSNETSIFIDHQIVDYLGLIDGEEFTFNLDKENILKSLSFTYSFKNDLFNKQDNTSLDLEWFKREYDLIINHFNNSAEYKVVVNRASGDRYYFKSLKQNSGFNIRNLLIQDHFKLAFSNINNSLKLIYSDLCFDNLGLEDDLDDGSHVSAKNIIFYGAPGTGKSHKITSIIESIDSKFYERVTFHPEYDNNSFIGGYKPISTKDDNGNEIIKYMFVPQVFTNIYRKAWQDLNNQYYLVIEEINRGNCAEIFGDIFQLLDRGSNYNISPSQELWDFLVGSEGFNDVDHPGIKKGLKLPPNLNLLATMNTSDQSLFPMDSAFKRRWEWEYVPICYSKFKDNGDKNDSFDYVIETPEGKKYSWIKFIELVNMSYIKNNQSLGMDKCIGNYFIKPDNDNSISLKSFINKVIFYLWNDVFKDENEDNSVFEKNCSYEDFFPIEKGKFELEKLFERIGLKPNVTNYELNDSSQITNMAAEDPSDYENSN